MTELYICHAPTRQSLPGIAAAVAVVLFLVVLLLVLLVARLRRAAGA